MGLFSAAEEVPKAALQRFAPFSWQTFPDYLEWLQRSPLGLNVLTQVGHSAVRRYVMGEDALERAATDDEIASMVRIVEEALDAGAAGLSSSQAPHQVGEFGEHIPSFFAADDETEALAAAVRRSGKRLLSINPRSKRDGLSEEDRALLVKLAEISGAVVSWNDFGMSTPGWETSLEYMESELRRGHEIYAIARCQRPETRFTLKKISAIFASSQAWLDYSRLDPPDKIAALGDPAWRARLSEFWETARYMAMVSVEKGASAGDRGARRPTVGGHRRGTRRRPGGRDVRRGRRGRTADVLPHLGTGERRRVESRKDPEEPGHRGGDLGRRSPPPDLCRRRLHELLPRALGAGEGRVHPRRGDRRPDVAGRRVPRSHRSRHARNREGGRPGDLRPRDRRATRAADPRRHPRGRDPDDQGRTRHRLGRCQREPGRGAREAHRRGPGPCARDCRGAERHRSGRTVRTTAAGRR